jgi:leader peptidase (prepilin peptidase) / N-methyltransferase
MEPLSLVLAAVGGALGGVADRFATRWPEHDEEHPPGRVVDWRTLVCAIVGAMAFAGLPVRFGDDQLALVLFGAWFVTLIVGLATDLDQRLLPDVLTLPVIPVAAIYAVSGLNPLIGPDWVLAVAAAIAIPLVLYLPSIPFGVGAFGMGDVKFLVGMGLMLGGERALGGTLAGLLIAGGVLLVLLLTRRISRRTYVPFGPFLILGALWAVLVRP